MISHHFLSYSGFALPFLLFGCSALDLGEGRLPLKADLPAQEEETTKAKPVHADSPAPSTSAHSVTGSEPGWRRIVYRGRVEHPRGSDNPLSGTVVSVWDGNERLFSTFTDAKGAFELPCDLYGTPFTASNGKTAWRPESYYAIAAEAPSGEFAKRRLREMGLSDPVVLEISPG